MQTPGHSQPTPETPHRAPQESHWNPTGTPLEPHNIHKELQPLPGNNPSWTQNTQPFSPINPYPMPCPGLGCCCKWHCSCSVWNTITKSPLNPYQIVRSMICSNPRTWEMCKWSASKKNSATHQTRVSSVKFTSIATTCSNLTCSGEEKNVDIEWDGSCIAQMLQKSMKSSMGEAEIGAATCTSSSNLDFFEVWN